MKALLAIIVCITAPLATASAETPPPAKPSKHWAFQPVVRAAAPAVSDQTWVRNPIDAFILARLEKEGLHPAAQADRTTLIRRVFLDLIGLAPSIEEVDAFLADTTADAYERVVDRLLASPHFGERWSRRWLDQARYADSNGFNIDAPRSIWKYRDWVIDALNRDLPFDQFVIEQLAGDLLPSPTTSQRIATGFHRNTLINQEGGIDLEQFRVESVVDRVNTTGAVFLGLTIGCAQCHDHKYDPISQREYYQLFAFLNSVDEPELELPDPGQLEQREKVKSKLAELQRRLKPLDGATPERILAWERQLTPEIKKTFPQDIQAILKLPDNGRSPHHVEKLEQFFRGNERSLFVMASLADQAPFFTLANARLLDERLELEGQIAAWKKQQPKIITTMVVQERKKPRETFVHLGGDFLRKGDAVAPATPAVLPPLPSDTKNPSRLDLARWLVDPKNPLTPRVTVNRIWQEYFGVGLVETENDFGTQGTKPSHPELLDWLASELIAQKWSLRAIHRLIVTSATYRQSSGARPELASNDPRNRLLGRQARLRLDAEIVRDISLSASKMINPHVGGPSVFPPQPEGVFRFTQIPRDWQPSTGPERYRRGMYTWFWRSSPHPALTVFDAPDSTTTCTRRTRSNTPLQALTLLNDQAAFEFAQGLARSVLTNEKANDGDRIRIAFRLCLARQPKEREEQRLEKLLAQVFEYYQSHSSEASTLLPDPCPEHFDSARFATWLTLARVLMNLDEFMTRE